MSNSYNKWLKFEPILHILFWFFALFFQYLKFLGLDLEASPMHCFTEMGFNMIPAYLLYLWILPTKTSKPSLVIIPLMFILNAWIYTLIDSNFHFEISHPWHAFFITLIRHVSFSLFIFALFAIKHMYKKQKEIEDISSKEQQAQLRLLKSQINPHFLFNTLNTIYASALEKDEMTPELILKLSDNFRYILHEGQKNTVPIEKEVIHIKDYINLQEKRLSDKIIMNWHESIDNYQQQIPPLLIISFIENAFKYSSMLIGQGHEINCNLSLENNHLIFFCENHYNLNQDIDKNWKESGIGIQNTTKRLKLLFPDKHNLAINAQNETFTVNLSIEL
ncbi:MAG: histidine kinase [Alcanivoracaceae bacterium]|nr:histidine kinase [Alcanivoracaceae bacterium]